MSFPCLLVDGDGWVMPCEDDAELQALTEPDFIDDIVAAFDATARPLKLHLVGEGHVIALRPTEEPRPDELAAHVRAYFHHWTDQEAPEAAQPMRLDVRSIADAVHATPTRRRRRS
ncbi:hypothetical protein BLA24_28710 [Streptomyces cinnamoneus]|uniref:Uncharacterized protein n=1 Tax=Streptomyces cinnamoneus TaxID=53446 RepID=A0A2G1XBW5_STRCJ|nr:hypothetical protein [Streptomyces cinnamoneus]PHQ48691.1 hypothetical protein BLA24_28710 [Streptomyces cinnamoneus]PPT12628.1 hypothetical protein CYQ11_06755 [Streptomyces cinnamoneus]